MQQTKTDLLNQLVTAAQELPEDKLLEVCDFVGYMREKYGTQPQERGTAEAILQALAGTLHSSRGHRPAQVLYL